MKAYSFRFGRAARTRWQRALPLVLAFIGGPGMAQQVSEKDYFDELPVVLSVSRLAQPLRDVPGSVTVIDRDLIRRSGAREVADLLRLVPGFLYTARSGANPQASYHAGMDTYGARMQVYVDGRSLYSSFLFGDTNLGLRGIILEEIERIEVLRGSNSASYGANAFLGVVNIVTRNAADTHGTMVSLTGGDGGVNDNVARVGWGDEKAGFRVVAARRSDSGIDGIYDDSRVSRLQFRADWTPSLNDDVMFQLGAGEISRGDGTGTASNPRRTIGQATVHALLRWQRRLGGDEKLDLRFSHEREAFADRALVTGAVLGPVSAINDSNGNVRRSELGLQHSFAWNDAVRVAWGGEWRHEVLHAPALYFGAGDLSLHQWRAFGTLEWRPHEQWLLQASGMHESHSYTGSALSPRLAANFHLTSDHTLRAGASRSQRAPNFYELRADTRLFNLSPGNAFVPVGAQIPGVGWLFLSSGTVKAETLISQELAYLGHFREINLKVDARAFIERMNDRVAVEGRNLPNPALVPVPFVAVGDFVNRPGPRLHGFEYQFDWRPLADTRLMFSELQIRSKAGWNAAEALEAPERSSSLTWLQKLPGNVDFTAISTASTPFKWAGGGDLINTPRRLDLRLGKPFAIGATRGEVSATVQAVNGGHQIYKMTQRFNRRGFVNLRLDF
ncbi:TonB-dependent receptor [Sulfuritalea sp.]|uniref:TonB-dependent receptor plug domain-containing protein n=1 Tax=Sulfuritalea sp. TaxID=2480090 RepID=UPI001ACCE02E|nr:TonB-dependent receptor [Sulfuritalea sp.]MBN8474029.1 TonB-dependent receptor [Sulfuritalea sp.]